MKTALICMMTAWAAGAGLWGCQPGGSRGERNLAPPEISRDGDAVAARVNGTAIYQSDVRRAAAAQGLIGEEDAINSGEPVFELTLQELIDQRLLALDAVRNGIDRDDEAQRRLQAARERILGNLRVETHLAEAVNEESILELYQAQNRLVGRGEERRARQIVVADEQTAITVLDRLNDEEDFEALITEFSIDESRREASGDTGWVSREMLPAPLRVPIFTSAVGGRAGPVQSEDGWHVIEVTDRRNPAPRSYEDTREDIARFMTFDAIQNLVTSLRDEAEVELVHDRTEEPKSSDQDSAADDKSEATPDP